MRVIPGWFSTGCGKVGSSQYKWISANDIPNIEVTNFFIFLSSMTGDHCIIEAKNLTKYNITYFTNFYNRIPLYGSCLANNIHSCIHRLTYLHSWGLPNECMCQSMVVYILWPSKQCYDCFELQVWLIFLPFFSYEFGKERSSWGARWRWSLIEAERNGAKSKLNIVIETGWAKEHLF